MDSCSRLFLWEVREELRRGPDPRNLTKSGERISVYFVWVRGSVRMSSFFNSLPDEKLNFIQKPFDSASLTRNCERGVGFPPTPR